MFSIHHLCITLCAAFLFTKAVVIRNSLPHRVHGERQWPLFHSQGKISSGQCGWEGHAHTLPLYPPSPKSCGVHSSWQGIYTPPISTLPYICSVVCHAQYSSLQGLAPPWDNMFILNSSLLITVSHVQHSPLLESYWTSFFSVEKFMPNDAFSLLAQYTWKTHSIVLLGKVSLFAAHHSAGNHRLNMEVDIQSLFGLHVTWCAQLFSLAEILQPHPFTPAFGLIYEGGYRSAKIDNISL